jgi:dienelactone hydrolase
VAETEAALEAMAETGSEVAVEETSVAAAAADPARRTTTRDDLAHAYESVLAEPVALGAPDDPTRVPAWQQTARSLLVDMLSAAPDDSSTPEVQVVRTIPTGDGTTMSELSYLLEPGLLGRAYLILPPPDVRSALAGEETGRRPGVVFWHGHDGLGAAAAAGLEPTAPDNPHAGAAIALARAGFVVLAPDIRSFVGGDGSARHLHFVRIATLMGRTALGIFVEDAHRAVSVLASRDEVDADRIAVAGFSLGGLLATLSLATDDRVDAAVSAAFLGSYRDDFARQAFCPCEYPGGFGHELDFTDAAGIAAPRPLLFVMGERDPAMPRPAVERAFAEVERVYRAVGAEAAAQLAWHAGHHEWVTEPAVEFLATQLAASAD